MQLTWLRCVWELQTSSDWRESQHLISRGDEFQRVLAATEIARSPSVEEVLGTASKTFVTTRQYELDTGQEDLIYPVVWVNVMFPMLKESLWNYFSHWSQCKSFGGQLEPEMYLYNNHLISPHYFVNWVLLSGSNSSETELVCLFVCWVVFVCLFVFIW